MGLLGGTSQKVRDYGSKIDELKTKIVQLEKAGMQASADRLKAELKKCERPAYVAEKPITGRALKEAVKAAKGGAKA